MENKVALGTGGLTRIGSRAAASAFVRKGARIILYDNRDEAGRSARVPASFQLSENVIAPGGAIPNIGMNGMTIDLHMERFWSNSITTTTRVIDTFTTPRLLKTVASGVSNRRNVNSTSIAFSTHVTVGHATQTHPLKVIIEV